MTDAMIERARANAQASGLLVMASYNMGEGGLGRAMQRTGATTYYIEIYPVLYAPLTAYFDAIPADEIPLDVELRAEVVTTESLMVSGGY